MQRTSAGFIQKTLSFSYNYPNFLRTNSKMNRLNSLIMQMQHLGSRWLSYTREPLLTGFIETKVLPCASLMAKGLPWLSLRVLLLTLCSVEEADEPLLPAPATIAGTSMESGDKFRSDELGSVRPDQHPTPIALSTRISEAECSLAEKWYTDIWIDPKIKLKSLRGKLGKRGD